MTMHNVKEKATNKNTISAQVEELGNYLSTLQEEINTFSAQTPDETLESMLTRITEASKDILELKSNRKLSIYRDDVFEMNLEHEARKDFVLSILKMRNPRRYHQSFEQEKYLNRFQITKKEVPDNPLSPEESLSIIQEGSYRLGDLSFIYGLAEKEYTRGYRCPVCARFSDKRCWTEC